MDARPRRIRLQNDIVARAARRHHFDDESPVPFLCECEDESCREFVTLRLPDYRRARELDRPVVAAEHAAGSTSNAA